MNDVGVEGQGPKEKHGMTMQDCYLNKQIDRNSKIKIQNKISEVCPFIHQTCTEYLTKLYYFLATQKY